MALASESQYSSSTAAASWSQEGKSTGSPPPSRIRPSRVVITSVTSAMCRPYSMTDQVVGAGRAAAPRRSTAFWKRAENSRIRPGTVSGVTAAGSKPQSGQGRSVTHVQSVSSGTVGWGGIGDSLMAASLTDPAHGTGAPRAAPLGHIRIPLRSGP